MPRTTEQVDNPDHSLFRPRWNATKQSYAKQPGEGGQCALNPMPPIPSRILSYRSHRLWKMLPPAARISSTAGGQTILNMLHNAADLAEANSQHALDVAQKRSHQLRAAEARIAELKSEGQSYQERARTCGTVAAQSLQQRSRIDF